MKRVAAVLIIALSFGLFTVATAQKKAPNLSLKTGDGKTYELYRHKGKVVILNFWATWCGPCRQEIPDFIEVYKKYKDQGVEGYYDPSLLGNYNTRYSLFILVVVFTGLIATVVPFVTRFTTS